MSNEIDQQPHIAALKALGIGREEQTETTNFSPEEEWLRSLGVCGFSLENAFVQLILEYRAKVININSGKPIYSGRFPAIWFSADEEDIFNEKIEIIIDAEVTTTNIVLSKRDLMLFSKDKDAFRLLMKPTVFEFCELHYNLGVGKLQ